MRDKKFRELLDGWGFQRLPKELMQHDVAFCHDPTCLGGDFVNRVLYTDAPVVYTGSSTSIADYQRFIERLRNTCLCRFHFEKLYGEDQK